MCDDVFIQPRAHLAKYDEIFSFIAVAIPYNAWHCLDVPVLHDILFL